MTNELTLLQQESFGDILVDVYHDENNDVYMTRNQIGAALGYSNPQRAMSDIHNRNKERLDGFSAVRNLRTTDGKAYDTTLYNEKGIYEILRKSNQPKADAFYDFVYELLSKLRKGEVEIMRVPRNYLEALKEMTALVEMNQELGGQVDELSGKVSEYEPKAEYLDTILASNDTVNTTQIAKDYGLSAQALNRILREDGIQYQTGGQWVLYGKHVNKGYTKSHTHNYGGRTVMQTRWTQKGRLLVHETLKARGIIANMDKEE